MKIKNEDQAIAMMLFMSVESARHQSDIEDIKRIQVILKYKWDIEIPKIHWTDVEKYWVGKDDI